MHPERQTDVSATRFVNKWRACVVVAVVCLVAALLPVGAGSSAGAAQFACDGLPATIVGTPGPDVLRGTQGNDVIVALGGADTIIGRGGADTICGGHGADIIRGGVGPDTILAGPGNDRVSGGDGHDRILGGAGADTLQGNRGADVVVGGNGRDNVMGGAGLDIVSGGLGADRVNGGAGFDQIDGGAGRDTCSADDRVARCERATADTLDDFETGVDRVIHVSIDGLRSDHVTEALMPTLSELRAAGVSTLNARNDPAVTKTLPNHTSQFTGRPVEGAGGHGVDYNNDLGRTVHNEAGEYVASVFDVVHDHGLGTAVYAGKEKFDVIGRSWGAAAGGDDTTGVDNGANKLDVYERGAPEELVDVFLDDLDTMPELAFLFFHIRLPDSAGHLHTWGSAEYKDAVTDSDRLLERIVSAISSDTRWASSTAIIVTTDHGGPIGGDLHNDHELAANYTVPFVVTAPEALRGGDLYDLNPQTRRDPGGLQIGLDGRQPVRTHEVGNLGLSLLGLPAIPGSTFNADFDLQLR